MSLRGERALGALLCAGVLGLLPVGLERLSRGEGLRVDVPSARPFASIPGASSPPPSVTLGPPEILPRIEAIPRGTGPGLSLPGYRVSYGKRWLREVTMPLLTGPFDVEGQEATCGLAIGIGAGLFSGAAFQAEADRLAKKAFPARYSLPMMELEFPAVSETSLSVEPRRGVVHVALGVKLVDGTEIGAEADVKLDVSKGKIVLKRAGPVAARWSGKTREDLEKNPLVVGASMLDRMFGGGDLVGKLAQEEVGKQADRLLSEVSLGLESLHQPFAPFADRPDDRVTFLVRAAPRVDPQGVVALVCPTFSLAPPLVDPEVRVVPRLLAPVPLITVAPDAIALTANLDGVNQLLYLLWQSGKLRALGRSSAMLDGLPGAVKALAFELTGFDPLMPPVAERARPGDEGLRVIAGGVALGRWGASAVLGHAPLRVQIEGEAGSVRLRASPTDPRVSCAEARPGGYRLTPCLSDLMPAAAAALAGAPASISFPDAALLDMFSRRSFASMRLDVSSPAMRTDVARGEVHMTVKARLSPATP